jgi:hypothetical protein
LGKIIDEFIEYAKRSFGVTIITGGSSDYYSFDRVYGELPEKNLDNNIQKSKRESEGKHYVEF